MAAAPRSPKDSSARFTSGWSPACLDLGLFLNGIPIFTAELKNPLNGQDVQDAILDVLATYTTYTAYWRLLEKIESDPRYDKKKAQYLLKSFVELSPHAIAEKVRIMVEHSGAQVQGEVGGRAKAMIVTRSRLHAVRYKLAVDQYLEKRALPFKALVAFSGTVDDGGKSYTEAGQRPVIHSHALHCTTVVVS